TNCPARKAGRRKTRTCGLTYVNPGMRERNMFSAARMRQRCSDCSEPRAPAKSLDTIRTEVEHEKLACSFADDPGTSAVPGTGPGRRAEHRHPEADDADTGAHEDDAGADESHPGDHSTAGTAEAAAGA